MGMNWIWKSFLLKADKVAERPLRDLSDKTILIVGSFYLYCYFRKVTNKMERQENETKQNFEIFLVDCKKAEALISRKRKRFWLRTS